MRSTKKFPIHTKVLYLLGEENNTILGKKRTYHIPAFQRPYEWGANQIEDFLSSIDKAVLGEQVFMGTVQFNLNKINGKTVYEVIDGQQRITTFILLLCALEKECQVNCNIVIDNTILNSIERNTLNDILKVLTTEEEKEEGIYDKFKTYKENYRLIKKHIEDKVEELTAKKTSITEDIFNKIKENIYFVELTTKEMPLPKVVSIFNTINSTGLDLDSVDMFKLQFYEYLKNKESGVDVMAKICGFYKKVDDFNNTYTEESKTISMIDIINAYRYCIIAKYNVTQDVVKDSNEKFFDDVFKKLKNLEEDDILNLASFEKLLNCCLSLKKDINENKFQSINAFAINLLYETRYSKYYVLPYVFAFFSKETDEEKKKDKALGDAIVIYKYLFVNSINFDKTVNSVNTLICFTILKQIANNESIVNTIDNIIKDSPQTWWKDYIGWSYKKFDDNVKKGLYYNRKRAYIVCILSALLEEINANKKVEDIRRILFSWHYNKFDIEHIHARESFEKEKNVDIDLYNGIGNLVVLERSKNRSIGSKPFAEKRLSYKSSMYVAVNKLLEKEKWEKDEINERADYQSGVLKKFIFEKK